LDLLEDAGIPPPKPPIITFEDRAELARIALAQQQFTYVSAFFVGLLGGAAIAYYAGYRDVVLTIFKWALSGTGIALILSTLNVGKMNSFKCPRCDQNYFGGALLGSLLEAMRHLRAAAQPAGRRGADPVNPNGA